MVCNHDGIDRGRYMAPSIHIISEGGETMGEYRKGHHTTVKGQTRRGSYIIAYKGRRRDAKRHILERLDDERGAVQCCEHYRRAHPKWTVHVYNYCWEVIY